MEINFMALFATAITTLGVGFVWYHPKVFGTIWMKESNLTQEDLKKGNMFKIFGLTYVFSLMIIVPLMQLAIHQTGAVSMIGGSQMIADAQPSYASFMADYGMTFRTFKHGALHGFLAGLFFALPIVGTNSLFERKSWKYIFVHAGYWIVTLVLMGGIVCAFV